MAGGGKQNLTWRPKVLPGTSTTPPPSGPEKAAAVAEKPSTVDPKIFFGRWKDSLGNNVEVERAAPEDDTLLAKLTKSSDAGAGSAPVEPKVLKIMVDPRIGRWRCGNGVLDRLGYKGTNDSLPTGLSWITKDGRISTWAKQGTATDAQKADAGDAQKADSASSTSPSAAGETISAPTISAE